MFIEHRFEWSLHFLQLTYFSISQGCTTYIETNLLLAKHFHRIRRPPPPPPPPQQKQEKSSIIGKIANFFQNSNVSQNVIFFFTLFPSTLVRVNLLYGSSTVVFIFHSCKKWGLSQYIHQKWNCDLYLWRKVAYTTGMKLNLFY